MSRRKVPNAETAEIWIAAAERSGLTRVEWCAQAGVDARSLQAWRIALGRRAARSSSRFVELVPRQAGGTPPPSVLRVHAGDVVIELAPGFHAESLAEVLRVVRSC